MRNAVCIVENKGHLKMKGKTIPLRWDEHEQQGDEKRAASGRKRTP